MIATRRLIYPQAVGSDIGCGMSAVPFDLQADALDQHRAAAVLGKLRRAIPVMRHRSLRVAPTLDCSGLSDPALAAVAAREGRVELGTLGRGNHFVELQRDEEGRLWGMVHSGSRIMGQIISEHHSARASRAGGGLVYFDADTDAGRAYLGDAAWAAAYAERSRAIMLEAAADVIDAVCGARADLDHTFTSCHNHVLRESQAGENLWVHRKGANQADEGRLGIIPGSMASPSYHVRGRGEPASLCSSSHGAGRALHRAKARRMISPDRLRREMAGVYFDESNTARLVEEAPSAYRDVRRVMRAQRDLVRIVRTLVPVFSYKGP